MYMANKSLFIHFYIFQTFQYLRTIFLQIRSLWMPYEWYTGTSIFKKKRIFFKHFYLYSKSGNIWLEPFHKRLCCKTFIYIFPKNNRQMSRVLWLDVSLCPSHRWTSPILIARSVIPTSLSISQVQRCHWSLIKMPGLFTSLREILL